MTVFFYDSPLGALTIQTHEQALTHLCFGRFGVAGKATPLTNLVMREVAGFINGELQYFMAPIRPQGTPFQLRVWHEVTQIPYGQTITLPKLCERLEVGNAQRAVMMALQQNPLAFFVPCYRVEGSLGALAHVAGGMSMKKRLLQLEQQVLAKVREPVLTE
jgi:methylated-DNA-[protein]-cysteine S-methyltransferase